MSAGEIIPVVLVVLALIGMWVLRSAKRRR